jgi:hypothetical protein
MSFALRDVRLPIALANQPVRRESVLIAKPLRVERYSAVAWPCKLGKSALAAR